MLVFKTIKQGNTVYCGVKKNGEHLVHRFANERNNHGHDPGYVYPLRRKNKVNNV